MDLEASFERAVWNLTPIVNCFGTYQCTVRPWKNGKKNSRRETRDLRLFCMNTVCWHSSRTFVNYERTYFVNNYSASEINFTNSLKLLFCFNHTRCIHLFFFCQVDSIVDDNQLWKYVWHEIIISKVRQYISILFIFAIFFVNKHVGYWYFILYSLIFLFHLNF